jgi:hypothetical protein
MKFTIKDCIFCGWCGSKAVVAQEKEVRLLNYYYDLSCDLALKMHLEISIVCKLDSDGEIWIIDIAE